MGRREMPERSKQDAGVRLVIPLYRVAEIIDEHVPDLSGPTRPAEEILGERGSRNLRYMLVFCDSGHFALLEPTQRDAVFERDVHRYLLSFRPACSRIAFGRGPFAFKAFP